MIGPFTVPLWLIGRDTGRFHVGSFQTSPRLDVEKRTLPPKMSVPPRNVCETLPPEKPPRAGSADDVTIADRRDRVRRKAATAAANGNAVERRDVLVGRGTEHRERRVVHRGNAGDRQQQVHQSRRIGEKQRIGERADADFTDRRPFANHRSGRDDYALEHG